MPDIKVTAKYDDQVTPGLKKTQQASKQATSAMTSEFGKLGSAIKGVVIAYAGIKGIQVVTGFLKESMRLAKIQEKAEYALTAALNAKNKAYGALLPEMKRYASSLQEQVRFGDEQILAVQAVGLNLGITVDKIKDATKAAIGLTSKGIALESAMLLIGKAAAGDTSALSRYGIKLKEGLSDQEKFNTVLKLGAEGFDTVKEAAESATSQIEKQTMAIDDQKEEIGKRLIPVQLAWNKAKLVGINLMLQFLDIKSREELVNEVDIKMIERLNQDIVKYDDSILKLQSDLIKAETGFKGFDPFSDRVIETPDVIRHKIDVLLVQMKDANKQAEILSNKEFKFEPLTMEEFEPKDGNDEDDPLKKLGLPKKTEAQKAFKDLSNLHLEFDALRVESFENMQSRIKAGNIKSFQDEKSRIEDEKKLRTEVVTSSIGNALQLTAMFKDNNRDMFAFNKALAMGQATFNTYEAATMALKQGGPIFGPPLMAAAIALGFAQVAKIAGTEYKAALGADFVTRGPTRMIVGDNPGGRERVQVTPLSSPNMNGPQAQSVNADMSVVIQGNADERTVAMIAENQEQKLLALREMLIELNFRGQGVAA